jgi:hypothetical protein
MITTNTDNLMRDIPLDGLFKDLTVEGLPSKYNSEFIRLKESFVSRRKYTREISFALFCQEFAMELQMKMEELNIKNFIELKAGNGTLTLLLNNLGLTGIGYTLSPDGGDAHWGLSIDNKYFKEMTKKGLLKTQDITEAKISDNTDMIVASWIPYHGGQKTIAFFENNSENLPEYFLLIGEDEGGCTSSDEFFEWLYTNFEIEYDFEHFERFEAIYDSCILYKRRLDEN